MRLILTILLLACGGFAVGCSEQRQAPPYAGSAGDRLHDSLESMAAGQHGKTLEHLQQFAAAEKAVGGSSHFAQAGEIHESWRYKVLEDAQAIRSGRPQAAIRPGDDGQQLLQALAALQAGQRERPWRKATAARAALNRLKPYEASLGASPSYQEWRRQAQTETLRLEESEQGRKIAEMLARIDRRMCETAQWQDAFREAANPEVAGPELASFAEAVEKRAAYPEMQRQLRNLPPASRPACQELLAWGFQRPELVNGQGRLQTSCGRLARILGQVRLGQLDQARRGLAELEQETPLKEHVRQILVREAGLGKEELLQPAWQTPAPGVADAAARLLLWQTGR